MWLNFVPDDMKLNVKNWKIEDKHCYVTKAVKVIVERITGPENVLSVTGVPGSGKSMAIRHAALYLNEKRHFIIYSIKTPADFKKYLDMDKKQVFVISDPVGKYGIDINMLEEWKTNTERIENCLNIDINKNTKVLMSIRIQLLQSKTLKGRNYLFNNHRILIDLSAYSLDKTEMSNMLKKHLVRKELEENKAAKLLMVCSEQKAPYQFVDCFPLLCKILCENYRLQQNASRFFKEPFPALINIFHCIQNDNKHQFCGLLLCCFFDRDMDNILNPLYEFNESNEEQKKIRDKRDMIIKSQSLNPQSDLDDIKNALKELDGIYVVHIKDTFKFSHSIFHDMVTYIYNNEIFVFEYASIEFINNRVRIDARFCDDDEYVLVFDGASNIVRLADRLFKELIRNVQSGATCISCNLYADDERLIERLKYRLSNSVNKTNEINALFRSCMMRIVALDIWFPINQKNHGISKLTEMLIECGADCNMSLPGLMSFPLQESIKSNCLPLTEVLLTHGAKIHTRYKKAGSVLNCFCHRDVNEEILQVLLKHNNYTHILIHWPRLPEMFRIVHFIVQNRHNTDFARAIRHFKMPRKDILDNGEPYFYQEVGKPPDWLFCGSVYDVIDTKQIKLFEKYGVICQYSADSTSVNINDIENDLVDYLSPRFSAHRSAP